MLVTVSQMHLSNGNFLTINGNAQTSIGQKPGTDLAFDPETGLIFVAIGQELWTVSPTARMRVADSDVPALREWLKARGAKSKPGKAA